MTHREAHGKVLKFLANKLNQMEIEWLLGASSGLMVWGVDVDPDDIDILVNLKDIRRLETEFKQSITRSMHEFPWNGHMSLKFQMKVDDVEIEILELDLSSHRLVKRDFMGIQIPVNSLEVELEHYKNRIEKQYRVPLIEKRLEEIALSKAS